MSHRSSDGNLMDGAPRRACGCQSCRHRFGPPVEPLGKMKIEYSFRIEREEDVPVRGNALASGDDEQDRKAEDEILERLERDDILAWCTAIVTARVVGEHHAFQGTATLGCCSYVTEDELKRDVFEHYDLKGEALDDLRRDLQTRIGIGTEAAKILKAIGGA